MLKQRNIAVQIILTLVTCGIYGLYWLACLNDDTNTLYGSYGKDMSGGVVVLLTLVTCGIYGLYWMYVTGNKIDSLREQNGLQKENYGILLLLLSLVGLGIISYCIIQNELNKLSSGSSKF
ncbi:MAG: DUF4234 domain-containing protein [Lachnospiraceae bacterium]|nr:DUF4234 domain-containing protein [Lachnospiraceae bacterium]